MSLTLAAARFAAAKHHGQLRKFKTVEPYIRHPARVAGRVAILPESTEEMVAAAWLHDVMEDCGVEHRHLAARFGYAVAGMVFELTDQYTPTTYPMLNRKSRKELEAKRLAGISEEAMTIKLLDVIDNLTTIDREDKFFPVFAAEKEALLTLVEAEPRYKYLRELVAEARAASQ